MYGVLQPYFGEATYHKFKLEVITIHLAEISYS